MSRISSYASGLGVVALATSLMVVGGCGQEEPPPELPPRAIQWERISGAHSGQQRVISGIVMAVSDTQLAFEVVEDAPLGLGHACLGRHLDVAGQNTAIQLVTRFSTDEVSPHTTDQLLEWPNTRPFPDRI